MNKAILVIDMPDSCDECSLMFKDDYSDWCPVNIKDNQTDIYGYTVSNTKPSWCPLKPLPDKVEVFMDDWADGYNACLGDILE